ncbi:aminotransferase class I/II-fold pyridoxal phosphate-dependent enzyme [Candidatus Micrarchaeota archaeon]|nr:aminotransferase class I/II-fold pyridoxal phosphate-dependent enzyme [Candidatus Micrarchaeota archaeon]
MSVEPSSKSDLVSYPIRDIVQEAKKIENSGTKMLYLNVGDPAPFGFRPPKHILDAAADALRQDYSGYAPSAGDPELRQTIAKFEKVSDDDVFVTAGLSEGIDLLYQAMLDPGRNILLPSPSYPLYITKERMGYGTMDFYDCDENYEPDLENMRKNINKYTKAILVINPNNPTGAVYSRKTLQGIVDLAGEYKLPIISDDVYDQMVFEGDITHMRDLSKDVPVVCGNSLSKNYIYPGARAGYIAFHGEGWGNIKDAIQRLCNQRLSVNWEMQRAYIAALKGSHDHIHQFNKELKVRKDILMKRVNDIDGLSVAAPRGAFYSFIKIESTKWKSDSEFVRGLLKYGVVVVPGSGFAPNLNGKYFRLVFLAKPDQLNYAFDQIEKYMKA